NNRSAVRVIANRIEFLDSKGQSNSQPKQQQGQAQENPFDNSDFDDSSLPF
ncbi:single-stranded DNA-binding protein, partial [Staphylococcus agnetis]